MRFPGERQWSAWQLVNASTIRFLRAPYAGDRNAGYILVDLDVPQPMVLETMRAHGHDQCVVLQTSPGHLQAWVCLRTGPLEPAVATAAGKWLAHAYGGDPASTDWRHLGRLAGFTNQKPARRASGGHAPWVRLLYARAGLAPQADSLLQSARPTARPQAPPADAPVPSSTSDQAPVPNIAAAQASAIYRGCMQHWRIADRFPQPDWSIVDLWVARHLLSQGTPASRVETILRLASPHFPRRHHHPDDYLRRTLARAAFPAPGGVLCDGWCSAPAFAAGHRAAWNPADGEYPKAECERCPPSDRNLTHRDGPPRV